MAMPQVLGPPPADWHPDPTGRHELRYWDGNAWSAHVWDKGVRAWDPIGGSSTPAQRGNLTSIPGAVLAGVGAGMVLVSFLLFSTASNWLSSNTGGLNSLQGLFNSGYSSEVSSYQTMQSFAPILAVVGLVLVIVGLVKHFGERRR
jgi:hypothetical protein